MITKYLYKISATIVVLANAQVDTIKSYGEHLHTIEGTNKDHQLVQTDQIHEAIFMMLQLINGLKCLQARGVEEIPESLTSFIILKDTQTGNHTTTSEDRLNSLSAPKTNCYGRLCILQGYVCLIVIFQENTETKLYPFEQVYVVYSHDSLFLFL